MPFFFVNFSWKHQCIRGWNSKYLHLICHLKFFVKWSMFSVGWAMITLLYLCEVSVDLVLLLKKVVSFSNSFVHLLFLPFTVGRTWNRWSLCTNNFVARTCCELSLSHCCVEWDDFQKAFVCLTHCLEHITVFIYIFVVSFTPLSISAKWG